jgi:cytochrome c biogenesis protein CcmG/thiol:disulfide interchange protein DsbE
VSLRRRGVVAVALVALTATALLLGSALAGSEGSTQTSPLVGSKAPALSGRTLSGSTYTLDPKPHTLTLVNVWASWCGPCRDEVPLVADTARRWSDRGVRVVTVDTTDGPVAARSLLAVSHAKGLLTVQDPQGRIAVAWGVTGVPETFVVDGRGVVRAHRAGPVTRAWLAEQLGRWAPS